ncbi:hypothetical protein M378DRAFT_19353 [Amanita muscaria Koide BX008]|uniref:Uncharacterized protein n=1 Tax=Amanita muscaria (strain Koide BX008) TaxID=946122 RepID=A0A0C2RUP9_AMAMK|nr:hypothetical protein M378DRAFT_19353 [Amanita muscaria Koide BX008]
MNWTTLNQCLTLTSGSVHCGPVQSSLSQFNQFIRLNLETLAEIGDPWTISKTMTLICEEAARAVLSGGVPEKQRHRCIRKTATSALATLATLESGQSGQSGQLWKVVEPLICAASDKVPLHNSA